MADYSSLKVPELKKLLQEKSLPVAGNKADLIARLQEHDKSQAPTETAAKTATADDEIDWDDDDPATTTTTTAKPAETAQPVEPAAAAVGGEPEPAASKPAADAPAAETTTEAPAKEEPAAPKIDFSAHLAESNADEEARKRAERAKRFGIVVDENEEEKKKAERAKKFGGEEPSAAVVKGLDSALPERREKKRGREAAAGGEQRDAKRQSTDGRRGGGRFRGRDRRRQGDGDRREGKPNGGAQRANILTDPTEKAKAEARAKRFGA